MEELHFENGSATRRTILELQKDGYPEAAVDYLADFENFPTFRERLLALLQKTQTGAVVPNVSGQIRLLNKQAADKGVQAIPRATLLGWLTGKAAPDVNPSNRSTRENLYKLCAILGFDYQDTVDFFRRTAFARPFNLKQYQELIWFFFAANLQQNDWYAAGLSLSKQIEADSSALKPQKQQKIIGDTDQISQDISALHDELALKAYILQNWGTFRPGNSSVTARREVAALYAKGESLAALDCFLCDNYPNEVPGNIFNEGQKAYGSLVCEMQYLPVRNLSLDANTVFSVIQGHNMLRQVTQGTKLVFNNLNNAPIQLHNAIRVNFPTADVYQEILKAKNPSLDKLRKMLILLNFYVFYMISWMNTERRGEKYTDLDYSGLFDEFVIDTDSVLYDCGYTSLYARNPYDCLFLFCAQKKHPLDYLRAVIAATFKEPYTPRF